MIKVKTYITCDECLNEDYDECYKMQAIAYFRSAGWVIGTRQFCPKCAGIKINAMLGERIKAARESENMTMQQLAEAVGKKRRATINRIEKGTLRPGIELLDRIAKALGVTVDYLIHGDYRR